MADIYIGNIKGPQGNTGATGAQGPQGEAATIEVGTVSTTAYGNTAQVINSGTENEAVFDFVIPQGRPGEETTRMSALTLDTVTASSASFPVPATGENGATVWGKVIKFFNDVKSALANKINYSDCVTVLTNTSNTLPLAASQGKALNDALANKAAKSDVYPVTVAPYATITENTNLNSYTTPGKYICNSSTTAGTLSNTPYNTAKVNYAFYMITEKGASDAYIIQTLYGVGYATCPTFRRFYNGTSWSIWNCISTTAADVYANSNLNGYIVPGRWICSSASIATGLVNCPTTAAFVLEVENGTNLNYIVQTLKVTSQATVPEYRRTLTVDTWGAWKQIVS